MKLKLLIPGILLAVLLLFSACGKKGDSSESPSPSPSTEQSPSPSQTPPEVVPKEEEKHVMDELEALAATAQLKEVAAFIMENKSGSPQDVSKMILRFEELQKGQLPALEASYSAETIQKKFQEEGVEDPNESGEMEDEELKDLVERTKESGFKVEEAEGSFFPVMDYSFYKGFSDFATPDIAEYVQIMSEESENPPMKDAALVIEWVDVISRALKHEAYLASYGSSKKAKDVQALFERYTNIAFFGSPNTPLFDSKTKKLEDDAKSAYEQAIEKNKGESEFITKLSGFMDKLKSSEYKLTPEVEAYRSSATQSTVG